MTSPTENWQGWPASHEPIRRSWFRDNPVKSLLIFGAVMFTCGVLAGEWQPVVYRWIFGG